MAKAATGARASAAPESAALPSTNAQGPELPASAAPPPAQQAPADPFDAAFAEAAAATIADLEKPLVESAATPKKPPPAAPPAAEPVAEPVAEPAPEPPPQPQPPPPSPQPQPQPQPQPPPAPSPQPRVYQEPPLFNPEEAVQLQSFYSEWPDVARATEVMVRGVVAQTVRRMYADMASSLAPYLQTIDTLADRSQLTELQGQVSDYDTVSGQMISWASRQPAYLRTAYEHVIKSGTAAEVVDLINRYKQDTMPAQAPVAAPAAAPAPAVNPALAAAAARLAPVATKRTTVVAPPTDFDTAFAEFAKAS